MCLQASDFTKRSAGSPGNIEEVPVRGGRLQLLVPPACSNVAGAVARLLDLASAGHLPVPAHEATLLRLQADLFDKGIGVRSK